MYQKYIKNLLITSLIIGVAWANTYILYADKKKVENLSFQVNTLKFELNQSKQAETEAIDALNNAEKKIREILSQKQNELDPKPIARATPTPVAPAPPTPVTPVVTNVPVVTKPVVVRVTKPSRSTRAS